MKQLWSENRSGTKFFNKSDEFLMEYILIGIFIGFIMEILMEILIAILIKILIEIFFWLLSHVISSSQKYQLSVFFSQIDWWVAELLFLSLNNWRLNFLHTSRFFGLATFAIWVLCTVFVLTLNGEELTWRITQTKLGTLSLI